MALLCERLSSEGETDNSRDGYAVVVVTDGIIVGHVTCTISETCSLFLSRGRCIIALLLV